MRERAREGAAGVLEDEGEREEAEERRRRARRGEEGVREERGEVVVGERRRKGARARVVIGRASERAQRARAHCRPVGGWA